MNKHNYKAGVLLACLLSCCPIANAHPQQETMIAGGSYNQQNYKQINVSKKSSSGNMLGNLIFGGLVLGGVAEAGHRLSTGESLFGKMLGKETTDSVDIGSNGVNNGNFSSSSCCGDYDKSSTSCSSSFYGDDEEPSTAGSSSYYEDGSIDNPKSELIEDGDPAKYCYPYLKYSIDDLTSSAKYNISMKIIGRQDLAYVDPTGWPADVVTFKMDIKNIGANTNVAFKLYAWINSELNLIYDSECKENFEEQCRTAYTNCNKKFGCKGEIPDRFRKWFQKSNSSPNSLSSDALIQQLKNGELN